MGGGRRRRVKAYHVFESGVDSLSIAAERGLHTEVDQVVLS